MDFRVQVQREAVADEVSALVAVVQPILAGLVWGLKGNVAKLVGGRQNLKLAILARMYRPGDGDCGICFEYAVHDAIQRRDQMVLERVDHALAQFCGLRGASLSSILFAVEKTGSEQLIETKRDLITPESRLMYGTRGQPVKLHKHIEGIAQAFRRRELRERLPSSISGVWKADLFLGRTEIDRWVATSVKVNPKHLEGGRGLRVAIVPASHTETDAPFRDDRRNLIVCPLLHDGNFMQIFYEGWQVVQAFLRADARVPSEVHLPRPPMREVAHMLEDRREYRVMEVIDALASFAQPELLASEVEQADVVVTRGESIEVQTVLVPQPKEIRPRP